MVDLLHPGIYRGVVVNNSDPQGRGRLQLQIPQLSGTEITDWVEPSVSNVLNIPNNGRIVYVAYEGGDARFPVWFGQSTGQGIPSSTSASYTAGTGISIVGTTISNTGIVSLAAGTGISVSGNTITNTGIVSLTAGSGISVSGSTITNTGILSLTAGSGISVSGSTITNTGVLSLGTTHTQGSYGDHVHTGTDSGKINFGKQQATFFSGWNTSGLSIPATTWTKIPYNNVNKSSDFSYTAGGGVSAVPVPVAGYYAVAAHVAMPGQTTTGFGDFVALDVRTNSAGSDAGGSRLGIVSGLYINGVSLGITADCGVVHFAANDTVEMFVYQSESTSVAALGDLGGLGLKILLLQAD